MNGLVANIVVHRGESFILEVSLAISAGQTAALLGPNGAGKTTAVAALAGLLPLASGRVELNGAALDDPEGGVFVVPEMRRVGVVFQDYLLFPHLTVVENIAFGPRSRGESRAESLERASHWMDRLELGGLENRKPAALSGGQAQQVALARALAVEPELLLLDEPLAALDITTRARLRRVLAEHLEAFSGPRLLVTHDPTEAFLLGEEICVIEEGAVTQSGSPDEIRMRPRTAYIADLSGVNLFAGIAAGGAVELGAHRLYLADQQLTGPVLVTVRPSAVALYPDPPLGSPRNTWRTVVTNLEMSGDRVRVRTGEPLPLTVEITNDASHDLALVTGAELWVAIKATDIGVEPDHASPG